ncbi:hypothetical protein PBRA_001776 [Plasmodiophora brassicae]|uniref:Carboxypeptidase n=1 Tax=Plasmodiophora brassicae TaxID=37360 RepID=A0A0G4IZR1_PLABS|nr:hypothetical protein PBRA_001776 [Plasmodiophora brassicae]
MVVVAVGTTLAIVAGMVLNADGALDDPAARSGRVHDLPGLGPTDTVQYAGYVDLDEQSAMFYWAFEHADKTRPLVIWLQGGPGSSSLFGLFTENGPYTVDEHLRLHKREHSWLRHASLLYVDNPVASDFVRFLDGWFRQHPQYLKVDLYITGESYAGKFIPEISYRILECNRGRSWPLTPALHVNLKGIAIGGPWVDPLTQIPAYTSYAFALGLLDGIQKAAADDGMAKVVELISLARYNDSSFLWDDVARGIYRAGGNFSPFDVRDFSSDVAEHDLPYARWVSQPDARKRLYVGSRAFSDGDAPYHALRGDDMMTSLPCLAHALDNVRVLLFNGQFDWVCNHLGVQALLTSADLQWAGKRQFASAPSKTWTVNNVTAGLVRSAASLTYVIVFNAGHMTPTDQPEHALDMIARFINGESFTS